VRFRLGRYPRVVTYTYRISLGTNVEAAWDGSRGTDRRGSA
jgi:hypothetical protein